MSWPPERIDPLAGSPWSQPATVAGFVNSPPNSALMLFAAAERSRRAAVRALDLGCGALRNAVPLAHAGWHLLGIDLSAAMLHAAAGRIRAEGLAARVGLALAPVDDIPARDDSFDLVIAHGIWNLARSTAEFRRALREAARVARPGAGLFVFTFSRSTLPADAQPVEGEAFVFTQFSGEPQCFLTHAELLAELDAVGFAPDPLVPLTELNLPGPGALRTERAPVIYEGAFRYRERPAAARG